MLPIYNDFIQKPEDTSYIEKYRQTVLKDSILINKIRPEILNITNVRDACTYLINLLARSKFIVYRTAKYLKRSELEYLHQIILNMSSKSLGTKEDVLISLYDYIKLLYKMVAFTY